MCMPDTSQQQIAQRSRTDEKSRQRRVTQGRAAIDTAFSPFGPDYYADRRNQFFNFGLPAVMDSFRGARDKSTFDLARRGHIGPGGVTSSSALDRMAALLGSKNQERANLMGRAFDFSNRERGAIEGVRSNLVTQLRGANDPSASFNAANIAGNASNIGGSPVTNLFANLTGIAGDAINPPVDWRALTAGLNLTPKPSSSVRVVT